MAKWHSSLVPWQLNVFAPVIKSESLYESFRQRRDLRLKLLFRHTSRFKSSVGAAARHRAGMVPLHTTRRLERQPMHLSVYSQWRRWYLCTSRRRLPQSR